MLRYRADALSVASVVVVLSLQITGVIMNWPAYAFVIILVLVRQVNLVEHNHAHIPIFRRESLNELLGWMCFLSNGVPLEFYEVHHVRNHHRFNQKVAPAGHDWSSLYGFTGAQYPDKPVGLAYYVVTFPIITTCHCLLSILRSPGSKVFRRFVRSVAVVALCSAALLWLDRWKFALFFALPWAVVSFAMGRNNYSHHVGCAMTSDYDSAKVNLRSYSRLLGFNIGYHVAHHLRPGLHWSLLPSFHETIARNIPADHYVSPLHVAAVRKLRLDKAVARFRATGSQAQSAPP
jgi:beta-carotene hydroxylase